MNSKLNVLKEFLKQYPDKRLKLIYFDPDAETTLGFFVKKTCKGRTIYDTIGLVPILNNDEKPKAFRSKKYLLTKEDTQDVLKTDDIVKLIEDNPNIDGFEILFYINDNDNIIFQEPDEDNFEENDYNGLIPFALTSTLDFNFEHFKVKEKTLSLFCDSSWNV